MEWALIVESGGLWAASMQLTACLVLLLAIGTFTLKSIISPKLNVDPVDMTGQVVVVTGANSGCGLETARMMAEWNATVVMACRDEKRGEIAAKDVRSSLSASSKGEVMVWKLDLESFDSIRTFAQKFRATGMPLNVLVNNAGVRYHTLEVTHDGIELHYQVNHLSHFLLSIELLEPMKKAARNGRRARIVHVSSSAHHFGVIESGVYSSKIRNIDELSFKRRMKESVEGVYGDTKLMQVVISGEMDRRLSEYGINSYAVHPGFVNSSFGKRDKRWLQTFLVLTRPFLARDPKQGAMTQVYAATSPQLEGKGGIYLDNCKVAKPSTSAEDRALAKWLWNTSMDLISV